MVDLLWKDESLDERQLVRWSCYSLELQRCRLCQHEYTNHSIVSVCSLRRVAMHTILCVMGGGNWQSRKWAGSRCNAPIVCCHIRPSTTQVNAGDVPQMVVLHGAGQCTAHVSADGMVWPGELTHPWHNPSLPAQLDSLRARQGGCHEGGRVAHLLLELVQISPLIEGVTLAAVDMVDVIHHHTGAVLSVHRVEHHCVLPPYSQSKTEQT